MVNKTFVLAFNYHEAKSFIYKDDLNSNPGNYIILNSPDQLKGIQNPTIKILSNAYKREDFLDMMGAITMRQGKILR
jgi:hypothetical protein